MALEVERRSSNGIVVLDVKGRLVAPDSSVFGEQVRELLDSGTRAVVLDLSDVSFIDSSGLGTLVGLYSSFRDAGGALKLQRLSKRASELMVLTKLSVVFEIFDEERSAIDSFFPERAHPSFDILKFVQAEPEGGE